MSDETPNQNPIPAIDLSDYVAVVVVKTDEIEGHVYRRGERCSVDAATLQAMKGRAMVESDGPATA